MLNQDLLEKFNKINLENDLKIQKNNLSYDFSVEIGIKIKDLYNLIKEAISYIKEDTPSEFSTNIERSINMLFDLFNQIKNLENYLGNDFDRQKDNIISSINRTIGEIFSFQDQTKLLSTLNFLKNDFFAKNTEKISNDMFEKWASGKDEGINKFIGLIEEKAKKAGEELQKAEKSTEVIEQVKSGEGFKEFDNNIEILTSIYEKEKEFSFNSIIVLSIILILFILGIKFGWLVDFKQFYFEFNKLKYINYPYTIYQAIFGILIFSLLSYLLKLSVDQYKIYSNLLINLKSKTSIIKSYLLFLKYGDDTNYAETNRLIIEKTLENLYKDGNGTHFGKEEKIDAKILEKIIEIIPKLK